MDSETSRLIQLFVWNKSTSRFDAPKGLRKILESSSEIIFETYAFKKIITFMNTGQLFLVFIFTQHFYQFLTIHGNRYELIAAQIISCTFFL